MTRDIMCEIFNEALKQLATKNQSTTELKSILEAKFSALANVDDVIAKTISRLIELHLINDTFFAESIAERYQHKGDRFIKQKLQQKGFNGQTIEKTLQSLESELERALPEAKNKFRTLQDLELKARKNKLLQFLSSRGFSDHTCYQIIDKIKSESTI